MGKKKNQIEPFDNAEDIIRRSRLQTYMNLTDIGRELLRLKLVEDPTVSCVATDGESLFYNPTKIMNLSEQTINYSLVHMAQHILLNHCENRNGRDEKWDYACDVEVYSTIVKQLTPKMDYNQFIAEKHMNPAGFMKSLPDADKSAEEIYKTIDKVIEPFDDHSRWDIDKMKRPKTGLNTVWDDDAKKLLDEGHESMQISFESMEQISDFVSKILVVLNSDCNNKRMNNFLKFALTDILEVELSVFLIKDAVVNEKIREIMLSQPLWIDWSQKYKRYIM